MGLPSLVVSHLRSNFKVDEGVLQRMLYVDRPGLLGGRNISQVRLFDPSLLGNIAEVGAYADMDNDRRALQFEGHFFKDRPRLFYLADQRS